MHKAKYYLKTHNNTVECQLCHHFCKIKENKKGICNVRVNTNGDLFAINYGKVVSQSIDPIEKKPLYHFLPNTKTYSLACVGCNFKCLHCQNADISQVDTSLTNLNSKLPEVKPQEIIDLALANNCPSISYTYTEPTVYAEYALDCMKVAKKNNLKNIWVSNGYMSDMCLNDILPYLDAINVDLKFFNDKTYLKIAGAKLQPILDNLIKLKENKVHLEITTLIIPTINDSDKEITAIAKFILSNLGKDTPWHISAFYPAYKLENLPPTDINTILKAQKIGKQIGLEHVYIGNV